MADSGSISTSAAGRRVLVVDDGNGLFAQVEAVLSSSASDVEARAVTGYLMALGEAGASDDSPVAIVGPIDALNGELPATARALRELAPSARLIGVTHVASAAERERAIAAGFDECIPEPLQAGELVRALAITTDSPAASPTAAPITGGATSKTPSFARQLSVIDELINPHGQVRDEAIRLLREESGIEGVTFTQSDPPENHASAPVAHLGVTFGHLHAPPPAAGGSLEPWAQWLARWLLLHKQQQDLWFMAMRDELSGAWNRRYFQRFLRMALNRAAGDRSTVTLLLFDVDDFKHYNDRYGHAAGDEILRETVKLMRSVVREQDVVARIGGDEFAVIFWDAEAPRRANSRHPADIAKVCERFRKAIAAHKFPKLAEEALGTLTISGGLASYPWDGQTPEELMAKADAMALQSKQQGKNAISIGQGI